MAKPWRALVQWDAVAVTLIVLVGAAAYVVWRFSTPSDCAWLGPDSSSWRPGGIVVQATPSCPLPAGRLVVGATPSADSVSYLLDDGSSVVVDRSAQPDGRLQRLREGLPTTLFTLPQFLLCLAMLIRQPRDRAAGAALVYSGGLFGSTVVTTLGLPAERAFDGLPRWGFLANTQITFSLLWGAAMLFGVMFPTPMTPAAERLRNRGTVAAAPAVLYLLLALAIWVATGGQFLAWAHYSIRAQTSVTVLTMLGIIALVLVRMILLRGEDGDAVARQQLLWVGGTGLASLLVATSLTFVPQLLTGTAILGNDQIGLPGLLFVVGLGIGLARYRMFDLEWLLVKILVYTAVLLLALGVYAAVSVVVERGGAGLPPGTAAVAGVVVVALAAPMVRGRVQRAVNWIVYRDYDDRYRTLSGVADRLSGRSVDFARVADDIRRALRIPRLTIRAEGTLVDVGAADPGPGSTSVTFPLIHGEHQFGALVAHTRGRGDRFSPAERDLLRDLARQVAVALHQAELAVELQRSRERLVLAREEERRALRRVLHDDIAPAVAGLGFQAETARQLVDRPEGDRAAAAAVLGHMGRDALATSQQLRSLAYDLRPPALDDRGLVAALEDHGVRMRPVDVVVDASGLGDLGADPLPAAVEVAAFRIATSALSNVHLHASAAHCRVVLRREASRLVCEVSDDGVGLPEGFRPGVGITSMRERAAELGGALTLEARGGGGTVVRVELPLEEGDG